MSDEQEGQVRLPASNYPDGTIICHYAAPEAKWRVIKHNRSTEDDSIITVEIQKIGGELNRGTATIAADCTSYIAVGGRLRGRMRTRAAMQRRAAATPPDTEAITPDTEAITPKKPEIIPVNWPSPPANKTAKKKIPANKPSTVGPRSKGEHKRGKPTVPITSLKLDPRNPFGYGSRIHAYFQAFLNGGGKTTYGQMVSSCVALSERIGVEDDEVAIRRDLNNQTHQWQDGKWGLRITRDNSVCQKGPSGRLAKGEHDKVIFTCVEVEGHTWDEHIASHRR